MLKELHEALGLAAAATLSAAVVLGAAAYRYQWVKGLLLVKRPALVRVHLWVALAFLAVATFHYLLARHVHGAQQAGTLALVLAFLIGLSFRIGRKHFQVAIKAKIAMVVLAALLLPIGHWLVEGDERDDHQESRLVRPPAVAVQAPASGAFLRDG